MNQQQLIEESLGRSFAFEQGGSLHVGLLAMVERPSGPHDDPSFLVGVCDGERSQAELDLTSIHDDPGEFVPQLDLWFDGEQTALDISEAFIGAPADALAGSGIPAAVLEGAVEVERTGDAGDGIVALLTQMCGGKLSVDPAAMLRLVASPQLRSFAEHEVEGIAPRRAFNARMPVAAFLDEVGLTSTTIINQIAVLGSDLRRHVGPEIVQVLDEYLRAADAQLAWLVDEHGRIETSQVVVTLNDFLEDVFRRDDVLEKLAREEGAPVGDVRAFVAKASETGRLAYINVLWQTYAFDEEVEPVVWPDAVDLTNEIAGQASRIRTRAAATETAQPPPAPEPAAVPAATVHGSVTVAGDMIETMAASSGAVHFVLTDVEGDAAAAMHEAQDAVMAVPHPDEPTEGLASFVSDVIEIHNGAHFWADISDMEEEPEVLEMVLSAVVRSIAPHIAAGHLSAQPV